MKYIVCVVDEFADLMMTSGAELTQLVQRLAQKSRAVGIHLILATQRPSVKVITGDLKANLPYRIAFKVSSAVDSVTILGKGGAERLLGNGDMILSANDELERVHGVYFSDSTIDKIINHIDMNTFVLFDRRVDFATGQRIFDKKNPIDVDLVAEIDEGVRPIADAELKRIKELRNISRCHRLDVTLWLLYHAGDRLSDSAVERFISNRNLFGYYFKWKSLRKVA
jgi:DNA segregation ATPase FtsK/SpoIIIE-like protein